VRERERERERESERERERERGREEKESTCGLISIFLPRKTITVLRFQRFVILPIELLFITLRYNSVTKSCIKKKFLVSMTIKLHVAIKLWLLFQ